MRATIRIHPYKLRRPQPIKERLTVGQYLLHRLLKEEAFTFFGEKDNAFDQLLYFIREEPRLTLYNSASLAAQGNMALGYARGKKLGVLLSSLATQESYISALMSASSEQIPLFIILGTDASLMPKGKTYRYFEKFLRSCAFCYDAITDAETAARKIDRLVDCCLHYQKPCILELPNPITNVFIPTHIPRQTQMPKSDPESLRDALLLVKKSLVGSKSFKAYLGRGALINERINDTLTFLEKNTIPFCLHPLARGMMDETHPLLQHEPSSPDCALFLGITPSIYEEKTNYFKIPTASKLIFTEREAVLNKIRYKDLFLYDLLHHLAYQKEIRKLPPPKASQSAPSPSSLLPVIARHCPAGSVIITNCMEQLQNSRDTLFERSSIFVFPAGDSTSLIGRASGLMMAKEHKRAVIVCNTAVQEETLSLMSQYKIPPILITFCTQEIPQYVTGYARHTFHDTDSLPIVLKAALEDEKRPSWILFEQ